MGRYQPIMRHKIIANPAAGKGKAAQLIPQVIQRLRDYAIEFDLVCTSQPWDASDLAYTAAVEGYDVVVSAGGDGTLNEVVNGLMKARAQGFTVPCLGIICIGRGNDFAYGAGIPTDWEEGCRVLAGGYRRRIDLGKIAGECPSDKRDQKNSLLNGGRIFGNGIGVGFDAVVNIHATKSKLSGFLGYTVAALRTLLLQYHSPLVKITCDDVTVTQPSVMVSIMNGRRMGGGFMMTPESISDDGLLDLCVAHQVSRATILMMLPRFMRGTQAGHPAIQFIRSRKVTIEALEGDLPTHIDGETICTNARRLEIEILPGAIEVVAPSNNHARRR
jgi:diacylglycerol kinase (ATP)